MKQTICELINRTMRPCLLAGAMGLLPPLSALAQINTSFTESERSPVNYSEPTSAPVRSCKSLLAETSFDVAVISARTIPADGTVPEHCQVFAVIRPEIRVWINLPKAWNERLYFIGEGGFAGHDKDFALFAPWQKRGVQHHFVTVFNDTGHDTRVLPDATFAFNSLEREIDFGFRALHLSTVYAKQLAETYYGTQPQRSYFDGCSTGGRQGMVASQRFPNDYDGILAGAPAFDMAGLMVRLRQTSEALNQVEITPALLEVLGEAIYQRCDKIDGLKDRVLRDPRQCDFVPARDLPHCAEGSDPKCFTGKQIEGLELLYAPVTVAGKVIQTGTPLGAEIIDPRNGRTGWEPRFMYFKDDGTRLRPLMEERIAHWLPNLAFEVDQPDMTWQDFDLEKHLPYVERSRMIHNGTDPDLSLLAEAGSKLIVYHGWADTGPNPLMTAEYFDKVYQTMGAEGPKHARLFMIPGMLHCWGGTNVDRFDGMTSLINWVEHGTAPDMIPTSREENGKTVRTRPVCAYPKVDEYIGKGSIDALDSFVCK